jgi:hypothetical protein
MEAVYAFQTANRSVMVAGLPADALGKTAISVVTGFVAFAGAAVTSWLSSLDQARARRQARIAFVVTIAALGVATFNLANYFGWARRTAEFTQVRATVEYAQAKTAYAQASARLAGESMGYEEEDVVKAQQSRARAVLSRGERPTGSEFPGFLDWLRAIIAHGLVVGMAAAFRLPAVPNGKRKSKRPQRGARTSRENVTSVNFR